MRFNGTTIPTTRDDTYDTTEVHRKSKDELYETAFNQDQREILDDFEPSGGGSSLPEVTASDNGKVLTVVEGQWDKADGGGAQLLIVTHTDDADVGVSRLDITFGELYEAFENGASIYSYHDDGSNKEWREMASIGRSDDDQYGHSGWIQFGDSERYDTEWLSTEEAMLQAYPSMSLN